VAATVTGRLTARRAAWVGGLLVVATAAMAWMAANRAPHPGSPLATRLAALRGLWPAGRREPSVVLAALLLVLAVDAAFVVLIATGRGRRLALPARASLAALAALVTLQGLHQSEHAVQVVQLLVTGGNADLSQGVLTRLNQELVHLVWTSAVWIGCALLLLRFRHNRWLWIAFAVAGIHDVEHIYLYTVSLNPGIALHGGVNGILATGGLIGGPLQRPYLHFLYNLLEFIPLVAALLDELAARRGTAQPAARPLRIRSARA
jgi:hypothetical protein